MRIACLGHILQHLDSFVVAPRSQVVDLDRDRNGAAKTIQIEIARATGTNVCPSYTSSTSTEEGEPTADNPAQTSQSLSHTSSDLVCLCRHIS